MANDWILGLKPRGVPLVPCCSPATLAAAQAELGSEPVAWAIEVSAHATDKVLQALGSSTALDRVHDQIQQLRRGSESCALAVLRGLRQDLPASRVAAPAEAVAGARDLVRFDIPLDQALRAIWMSHVHTYEALLAELERALEPSDWPATVRRVSELGFAYVGAFAEQAAQEYEAERERWLGSIAAVRRRMVEEILAGHPVHVPEAERVLAVRLAQHHVAAILWPSEPRPTEPAATTDRLRRTATSLAQAAQAPALLTVPGEGATLWVWLCWKELPPVDLVPLLREAMPADARLALGPVDRGREGFRRSHMRAREAERIARSEGTAALCDYSDVAVLALLTANPEHARWFVEDTLGELAAHGAKGAEVRETLRLYLAFGRSRVAAAERLHIAPTTVAYRVKRAETLLGRTLDEDELRLRLALELMAKAPRFPHGEGGVPVAARKAGPDTQVAVSGPATSPVSAGG